MAEKETDSDDDRAGEGPEDDVEPAADDANGEPGADGTAETDEDEELIGEEYKLDVDKLDFGDNFESDDDEEGGAKKKGLILIAAASVAGLAILGGGGWFLFSSSGGGDKAALPPGPSGVPRVVMEMPPRGGTGSMLTPPLGKAPGAGSGAGAVAGAQPLKAMPTVAPTAGVIVPSVTLAAFSKLSDLPPSKPVLEQVDPSLTEQTKNGILPKVGPNGQKPWKIYARSFDGKDARPRIAIIITGMGLSRAATEAAISKLPGPVTLAFTPYAQVLDDWAAIARRMGHEVLLSLPMESATFPAEDPGPYALLSEAPLKQNLERLSIVLARMGGYVGVVGYMGSLFSKDTEKLRPVLETLKSRGLMFVDNGATKQTVGPKLATAIGVPRAMTDLSLDARLSPAAIDEQLARLEVIARERAAAIAISAPYPIVLERLVNWAKTLPAKKLVLAPISALADVQFIQ
ncbi:MAG: divergent polysaccharide deacetylase family protein [Rhodospirillales bacterium]